MPSISIHRLVACALCAFIAFAVGTARGAGPATGSKPPAPPAANKAATKPAAPGGAARQPSTWHDYRDGVMALNRGTLAEAYKRVGKHGAWDADAVKFLDRMAVYFTCGKLNWVYLPKDAVQSHDELIAAGKALTDAGCTDPLVAYCYGVALHDAGKAAEALPHVRAAVDGLEQAGYPGARIAAAATRLRRLDPSSLEAASRAWKSVLDHRPKDLRGNLTDIERRHHVGQTWADLSAGTRVEQQMFVDRLRALPDADPWALNVLDGRLHIKLAWDARGSGFANTVTEQGWEGFFEHLTKARDSLAAAYKLAPHLPEASIEMITVSMGAGEQLGESKTRWFDRAVAAQLDHDDAYGHMLNALLPRWGGDFGQMYELGLRGMKTNRYDTIAPWQLVRAAQAIAKDGGGWQTVLDKPGVYEQIDEVARKYAAHAEGLGRTDKWHVSYRAALAWRAGKYDEARKRLDEAGERIAPGAFTEFGSQDPPAAIGHVYAMSGPQSADATKAEAAFKAGRYDEAVKTFQAIAAAPGLHARMKPYLDARIGLSQRRGKFAKGEWADVQPDRTLKGWKALSGAWEVGDDGLLVGRTAGRYMPVIVYGEPLGTRWEVSGLMEPAAENSRPGVVLTAGERPRFYVSFGAGHVSLFHNTDKNVQRLPAEALNNISGPAEFVVRYDNGTLSATVAGKSVLEGIPGPPPNALGGDPRIGVHVNVNGAARYYNLKVRKITDDPGAKPAAPRPAAGPANDGFD